MDRTILHCDCNSFFASVETLLDPSLADVLRLRSAVIRRAATASFSPRTRRPKPSAYKLPRPSGRRNGNARIYGW